MNKEELIGKLHMIYAGDRNALEEMVGYYDGLKEVIEIVQQENKQLKESRDKAIEYMQDFIFEGLLVNEDRKLIMYNQNLRNFEKILKGDSNDRRDKERNNEFNKIFKHFIRL